jgi:Tol biopolymer transport system component
VIKGVDSDIFIKDFRNDGTPPNLTSTTDIAEDFPVVSHDGTMIAYRAHHPDEAQSWEIRVARLTLPSTLTLLYPIRFTDPASGLIGAPEFSSDDKRIYVSGYLTEQETSQLFSINLDGSGQFQVTVTDERDYGPSVVPR